MIWCSLKVVKIPSWRRMMKPFRLIPQIAQPKWAGWWRSRLFRDGSNTITFKATNCKFLPLSKHHLRDVLRSSPPYQRISQKPREVQVIPKIRRLSVLSISKCKSSFKWARSTPNHNLEAHFRWINNFSSLRLTRGRKTLIRQTPTKKSSSITT